MANGERVVLVQSVVLVMADDVEVVHDDERLGHVVHVHATFRSVNGDVGSACGPHGETSAQEPAQILPCAGRDKDVAHLSECFCGAMFHT